MPQSSQGPPHSKCHVPTTGSDKACKILLDITDRAKNFTGHFYTSPETLQPTPFLYRALSTNALKTFSSAIEQKKLLELIHPIISDSICSALNFRHWHPSGKPTQAAVCWCPFSFLSNGYQLTGHSRQIKDFFVLVIKIP